MSMVVTSESKGRISGLATRGGDNRGREQTIRLNIGNKLYGAVSYKYEVNKNIN